MQPNGGQSRPLERLGKVQVETSWVNGTSVSLAEDKRMIVVALVESQLV